MSRFRLFCFKQFFKVHFFCMMMLAVFRLFMGVHLGVVLGVSFGVSVVGSLSYLLIKPYQLTRKIYSAMAISASLSLTIVSCKFLWIALAIDFINMIYFLIAMVVFSVLITLGARYFEKRKKRKRKTSVDLIKFFRILGWCFFAFLFFYQLVLSYLLRPNFLTVLALSISHFNLVLIIWTYFDVGRLYKN